MEGRRGGGYRGHRSQYRGRGRKWPGQWLTKNTGNVSPIKLNFYCCSCERGFATQELLNSHNEEHIVCGLDGCSFEAHALVVTKHIRMQHEGDLFSKLKNLSTPEDIQKWREERRKNYPTFGKKQEKEDTARERKERREICDRSAPLFRYRIENYHDNSFECDEYLKQVQYRQGTNWMSRMFAPDPKKRSVKVPFASMNKSRTVTLESFYMSCKVKEGRIIKNTKVRWKGFQSKKLQKLEDSEDEGDSTEIPISDEEDNETVEKPKGLMLVDYSSEEEGEIEEEEAKVVVFPSLDGEDDCEEKTFRIQEFSEDAAFKKTPVWGRKEVPTKRTWMKNKLLETLLQDQIRKERNVILQACRYLRENNFF